MRTLLYHVPMMIRTACISVLLSSAALAPAGEPTPAGFTCTEPELIGLLTGLNDPLSLTIDGDYAYIAQNDDSFLIVDLSDPQFPTLLANADDLPIEIYNETRIAINQSAAYIGGSIINIEDKADPWFVRYAFENQPVIANGYMYGPNTNVLLNVTRPLTFGLDAFTDPNFRFDHDIAAIINGQVVTLGLDRYDITDPLAPQLIDDNPYEPGFIDSWRYEAPYLIVDPRNTDTPIIHTYQPAIDGFRTTQPAGLIADDLTIRADTIFALSEGLHIYTLATEPLLIASYTDDPILNDARFIRRLGNHFLIITSNTLAIYDIRTNPVAAVRTNSHTSFLELLDNVAVLSSGNISSTSPAASVIDVSDPLNPAWLADLPVIEPYGLASSNEMLFVAAKEEGLLAFDLSIPDRPLLRATYDTSRDQAGNPNTRDVYVSGPYAYTADRTGGLSIYSIGPTQLLTRISSLQYGQASQRVRVQGNLALISSNTKLNIVDVTDKSNPFLLASIDELPGTENYIHTAIVHEQLLYTADENNGYRIFNLADPANPIELAQFDAVVTSHDGQEYAPWVFDLAIRNDRLYVTMSSGGLAVYDNANPFNPVLISHIPSNAPDSTVTSTRYRDIEFDDNLLYASAGESGLRVFNLNACAGSCPADLNADDTVDFFDVAYFLVAFDSQEPLADLEPDGEFNYFDVAAFLAIYQAGCP